MDSKVYILAIACLFYGLAGGYLITSSSAQNQYTAYRFQIRSFGEALGSSDARVEALNATIQSKDSQIQAGVVQIQAQ